MFPGLWPTPSAGPQGLLDEQSYYTSPHTLGSICLLGSCRQTRLLCGGLCVLCVVELSLKFDSFLLITLLHSLSCRMAPPLSLPGLRRECQGPEQPRDRAQRMCGAGSLGALEQILPSFLCPGH